MKRIYQPRLRRACKISWLFWLFFLLVASLSRQGSTFVLPSRHALADYLATWQLSPSSAPTSFLTMDKAGLVSLSPDAGKFVVRLLDRLQAAPQEWQRAWAAEALPLTNSTVSDSLTACRPVRLEGKVTKAVLITLSMDLAQVAGRSTLGLVTVTRPNAPAFQLLVPELPTGFPLGVDLDQRAGAVALLLSEGGLHELERGPALAVSTRLSWWPETPLGRLGMDYGLLGSVRDGHPLEAEEADTFYSVLAACRNAPESVVQPKVDETNIVPLLDPAANWFGEHRGDPVFVSGTARRIVRVPVKEPRWQEILGCDHYWEVFLFVPTPLIKVAGHLQESFPVVCCCLEIPAEIPRGERVNESIAISGFGFKRYRYETRRAATVSSGGSPQESPLILARTLRWLPAGNPLGMPAWGKWLPAVAALITTCALLWAFLRAGQQRSKVPLPEQIEITLASDVTAVDEAKPRIQSEPEDPCC